MPRQVGRILVLCHPDCEARCALMVESMLWNSNLKILKVFLVHECLPCFSNSYGRGAYGKAKHVRCFEEQLLCKCSSFALLIPSLRLGRVKPSTVYRIKIRKFNGQAVQGFPFRTFVQQSSDLTRLQQIESTCCPGSKMQKSLGL